MSTDSVSLLFLAAIKACFSSRADLSKTESATCSCNSNLIPASKHHGPVETAEVCGQVLALNTLHAMKHSRYVVNLILP